MSYILASKYQPNNLLQVIFLLSVRTITRFALAMFNHVRSVILNQNGYKASHSCFYALQTV